MISEMLDIEKGIRRIQATGESWIVKRSYEINGFYSNKRHYLYY